MYIEADRLSQPLYADTVHQDALWVTMDVLAVDHRSTAGLSSMSFLQQLSGHLSRH